MRCNNAAVGSGKATTSRTADQTGRIDFGRGSRRNGPAQSDRARTGQTGSGRKELVVGRGDDIFELIVLPERHFGERLAR